MSVASPWSTRRPGQELGQLGAASAVHVQDGAVHAVGLEVLRQVQAFVAAARDHDAAELEVLVARQRGDRPASRRTGS
jgi:hypothetical protein